MGVSSEAGCRRWTEVASERARAASGDGQSEVVEAGNGHDVDLTSRVRRWLLESGGSFEMRVARTLLQRGLGLEQGRYYVDPQVPTALREIDLVAWISSGIGDNIVMEIVPVIECKYANAPWVVSRPPSNAYYAATPIFDRIASDGGRQLLERIDALDEVPDHPAWQLEPAPGYAVATANLKGKAPWEPNDPSKIDSAYVALNAVTKAAVAVAEQLSRDEHSTRLAIVLPVIVITGKLFAARLTGADHDDLDVREVDYAQVHWSSPITGKGRVVIDVVTEAALDGYIGKWADAAQLLFARGTELARQVAADLGPQVF
jgi:hypothetical protein